MEEKTKILMREKCETKKEKVKIKVETPKWQKCYIENKKKVVFENELFAYTRILISTPKTHIQPRWQNNT